MSKLFGVRNTLPCSFCTRRNYTYEIRVFSWVLHEFTCSIAAMHYVLYASTDMNFFSRLRRPRTTANHPNQPKRVQTRRSRDACDYGDSKKPTTSSNGYNGAKLWTPHDTARGDGETTKVHLRGDGVALEPPGTTATPVSSIGGD